MNKNSGFTLVELIIVVAITGILIAVAVPSMRTYISNSAANSLSGTVLIDIMYARNHAITNSDIVKMIPTGTATTGASTFTPNSAGVNWAQGWTIFVDNNNDSVIDASELVIRNHASFGPDAHISSGPGAHIGVGTQQGLLDLNTPIGFNPDGTSINSGVLTIATFGCAGDNARIIQINQIGQIIGTDIQCPTAFTDL